MSFDEKAYQKKYRAERYAWLKERGFCTRCGKERAFGNYTMCSACLESEQLRKSKHPAVTEQQKLATNKKRAEMRRYRREHGLCWACGKPATIGRLCAEHYSREKRRYVRKYQPEGVCRCGKPVKDGSKVCDSCYSNVCRAGRMAQNSKSETFRRLNNAFWNEVALC